MIEMIPSSNHAHKFYKTSLLFWIFSFVHVLCVPTMKKNLISVSKICSSNSVSIEFLPISFHVKDFLLGVALLQGITRDNGESYIIS